MRYGLHHDQSLSSWEKLRDQDSVLNIGCLFNAYLFLTQQSGNYYLYVLSQFYSACLCQWLGYAKI